MRECICCNKQVTTGVAEFRGHYICSKECAETWEQLPYLEKERLAQVADWLKWEVFS